MAGKCIHSKSRMKFSYIRFVRSSPIGVPVEMMAPFSTRQVAGGQLTLSQPVRSFPLNNGTPAGLGCAPAVPGATPTARRADSRTGVSLADGGPGGASFGREG